jgi:hypothetical protein
MSNPRIWPTEQAAEDAKAPGETVHQIAGAWLTLPPGTDIHQLYASLQRGALTRPIEERNAIR